MLKEIDSNNQLPAGHVYVSLCCEKMKKVWAVPRETEKEKSQKTWPFSLIENLNGG